MVPAPNTALPLGFTAGGSVQVRRTEYEGRWLPFVREPGRSREDRTRTRSLSLYHRAFTVYGFSPQLVVTKDVRTSNAAPRLRAYPERNALRAPVLDVSR